MQNFLSSTTAVSTTTAARRPSSSPPPALLTPPRDDGEESPALPSDLDIQPPNVATEKFHNKFGQLCSSAFVMTQTQIEKQ